MTEQVFLADYVDGQTAAVRKVVVQCGPLGFSIIENGISIDRWVLAQLQVNALGQGVVQVENERRSGALLTFSDAAILHVFKTRTTQVSRAMPEKKRLQRLLAYSLALLLIAGAFYWGVSPISRVLARRIPMEVERRLTLPLEDMLAEQICETPASSAAFASLLGRLGEAPHGPVRLRVLNIKMENAFTFPGGSILVTRGLLDKAEGPDEIAGVIAHELAHVHERHIMAQVLRSSILSLGWAVTVGDFSGLLVVDPQTLFQIANQGFHRNDERRADDVALQRLSMGKISPEGFARFFERVMEKGDILPEWLSTHPDSKARLERIRAAKHAISDPAPALSNEAWQSLRSACAGRPIEDHLRLF